MNSDQCKAIATGFIQLGNFVFIVSVITPLMQMSVWVRFDPETMLRLGVGWMVVCYWTALDILPEVGQ